MFFLTLGILCNVILLVVIKAFPKFGIPTLQGIVINYFTAGSISLFFIPACEIETSAMLTSAWIKGSLLAGTLFIIIFHFISLTAQTISISVASVANKMSLVIPVILAFMWYGDTITFTKLSGIVLALIAVYYTTTTEKLPTYTKNNHRHETIEAKNDEAKTGGFLKKTILLPLIVFVGSGIIDATINYSNKKLIEKPVENALFTGMSFYIAGIIGLCWLLYLLLFRKQLINWKSVPAGILLGIPNFFSIYFILRALSENMMESSQLYAVANICIVLLSTLAGVILFKEKLSKRNYTGIALAVLAIILIMY